MSVEIIKLVGSDAIEELLPESIKDKIRYWRNNQIATYKEICGLLRDDGYDIDKIDLFRWCANHIGGANDTN